MGVIIPILLIIISCLIIWRACDGFDIASRYIGRNLSDGVRGATINAISSSLPELFTTAFFLLYLNDTNGFSGGIGTTAGSAVFNAVVIPALVILVVAIVLKQKNIYVSKKVILRDGVSLIIAEIILIVLITGDTLFWWHGIILMITYLIYIAFMLSMMNKKENIVEEIDIKISHDDNKIRSFFKLDLGNLIIGENSINPKNAWKLLIVSTFIIGTSCLLLVAACEMISLEYYTLPFLGELKGLNIPILFVAVILASAATSVPDTIISIRDAKNGDYNDALSNALGSNIFDICFALGFPLFLYCIFYGPIQMDMDTVKFSSELRVLLLIITIFSFLIFYFGKYMTKTKGILLFSIYFLFIVYIISLSLELKWALMISDQLSKIYYLLI